MRILWISPWFGNYRIPVYENLNRLSGNNFYLICSEENTSELVREKLKDTLGDHAIVMSGEQRMTMGNEESDFANSALVIKKQPGLYKAINSVAADVIITEGFGSWAPAGICFAVIHRKKLCMFYERTAYVERNSPIWRSIYRRIVGIPVDYFLINGTLTEKYLNDNLYFKKTPKMKGCMCADSFGLSQAVTKVTNIDKNELRKKMSLMDGLTFLFVGQMVERKGIKELLAVWGKHTRKYFNDNLLVIGKGILEKPLREQYLSDNSIHVLGGISYDELYKYYALCDVFIMPTLEDNWCLVIPEAMACGKPVACSIYNGGHYELVQNGVNGYKFDPLRPESIVDTLAKFHQIDLQVMGQKAIEIESNYTPDRVAVRIFDACEKVYKR